MMVPGVIRWKIIHSSVENSSQPLPRIAGENNRAASHDPDHPLVADGHFLRGKLQPGTTCLSGTKVL